VKRAPLLAAAALFAAVAASAADTSDKPFKATFIGEGGGYKAPDKATDDYLMGEQNQGAAQAPAPASVPTPTPSPARATRVEHEAVPASRPAPPSESPVRPASPGIDAPTRPVSARPAASGGRNAPIPGDARPSGRQSLWNGLVSPLGAAGSQASADSDPDAARADSDRDYETHILGMKPAAARAALGAPPRAAPAPATAASVASARSNGGKVFVSLEIDPREAGSLRDAVAGLGASAGFTTDARFQAMPGPGGHVLFSGWLPASRLGDAMSRPGVKRLQVEPRAQPSKPRETSGEFLVGLRVDDAARARQSVDAGVAALTSAAGFRLTRVLGLETAPDGRSVAVVEGSLPLSRLSKAMGLSEVAKIIPVGGELPAPASDPSAAAKGGFSGFAKFAVERGPWLIILTLLLLLPSLRGPARRAAAIFSPYH
jgi:hypothetical protein